MCLSFFFFFFLLSPLAVLVTISPSSRSTLSDAELLKKLGALGSARDSMNCGGRRNGILFSFSLLLLLQTPFCCCLLLFVVVALFAVTATAVCRKLSAV